MQTKYSYEYQSCEEFEAVISPMWGTKDEIYAVTLSCMRYRAFGPKESCAFNIFNAAPDFATYILKRFKTKFTRVVHIPPILQARLQRWNAYNRHTFRNGYTFSHPNSNLLFMSPNTLCKKFRQYVALAASKGLIHYDMIDDPNTLIPNAGRKLHMLRLYDLRASCITDYYNLTHDRIKTMHFAGHTDERSLAVYVRKSQILDEANELRKLYPATASVEGNPLLIH